MKKTYKICLITAAVIILIITTFISINIINTPKVITEQHTEKNNQKTLKQIDTKAITSGTFTKIDPIHYANGTATVFETNTGPILEFSNFDTANGPDLFVYLSPETNIKQTKQLGEFVSLGKLKSISGNQTYNLPENYNEYKTVVIWCRAFGVTFSTAELQ